MISADKKVRGPDLFRRFVLELGGPKGVAKFLDVTERTVWRWLAEDSAPRMAVLALYWETQYGRSLIDSDQANELRLLYQRLDILNEQYKCAKDIVTGLRQLHAGSANEAVFQELPELREWARGTWGVPEGERQGQVLEDSETLKRFASR